jgi:hypothetical protein
MNILQESIAFQTGTLQRWKALWSELSALFVERARGRLGKAGESISIGESQPDIEKQLALRNENFVIVGKAGGGKTALLAQFGAQAEKAGAEVFHCNADAVTEDELQDLFRSLRFKRAMCSLRAPQKQMCVLVDALDETEVTLRTKWAKQLARYGVTASATVVVSIRDSAWDGDGISRSRLQHWHNLVVHEWSEELVRRLISDRWSEERVSVGLLELIRQPLMLDIFWRTFIEAEVAVIERSVPHTRHQLLSAFWQERLIQSSRHKILGLQQRLDRVIAQAASSIANFRVEDADKDALSILLSESVVIAEGRLIPQYRFRHPLLRDFAIGVWCISAKDELGVAQRWAQIRGGLQRHGALRAIFEALADEQFAAEHAHLSRAKIVDVLLNLQPEAAAHLAHIFGTNAPEAPFDPALWPMTLQQKLPATFGTELLAAARLAGNAAWAQPVANWPADADWIDDRFPEELLNFISSLTKGVSQTQESQQNYTRVAAVKLRDLSEHSRFRPHFETNARWLKMAAMREIIPLLPDEQMLQWIERETPVASWRTRGFLLDRLIYVAPVDPVRTAGVYCAAVGLKQENGFPVLDPECWSDSLMDHHAIEWSLEGKDGRRSLLREFPKAFMPVAFMLAEALQNREHPTRYERTEQGLIDDYRTSMFWSDRRHPNASYRCIRAIQKRAGELADLNDMLFFSDVARLFRASPSLIMQSVYLDILVDRMQASTFRDALIECLMDERLYRFSAVTYWLETGVSSLWNILSQEQRAVVLHNIDAIVVDQTDESAVFRRSRFLASLPSTDLSPAHQTIAAAPLAEGFRPPQHPKERFRDEVAPPWSEMNYDEERIQEWPETFDKEQLRILSQALRALSAQEVTRDVIERELPQALSATLLLLPIITAHPAVLDDPKRFWILDAFQAVLEKHQSLKTNSHPSAPPEEFVEACAAIAMQILETYDYGSVTAPERNDVWFRPETLWFRALALADAALVWAPAREDKLLQQRFECVLTEAYDTKDPGVQVAVTTEIRPWHWLHSQERTALYDQVFSQAVNSAHVLAFSLAVTGHMRDKHRLATYQRLLGRQDIDKSDVLAEKLGEYCGHYSMVVFTDVGRSFIATLARDVIQNPDKFPLLRTREARVNFFRSFVFAMKEQAKWQSGNTDLAVDYGRWSLSIWRLVFAIREKRQEYEGIVLLAMHWLEREESEARDPSKLRVWWENLWPLVRAVAEEGNRPDCFTLFFNLRDPKMYLVLRADELLDSVRSLLRRLHAGVETGAIDLDAIDTSNEDHNSWREVLRNASEALETARVEGLFRNDFHLEESQKLLAEMAAAPFNVDAARTALYRLQNASI